MRAFTLPFKRVFHQRLTIAERGTYDTLQEDRAMGSMVRLPPVSLTMAISGCRRRILYKQNNDNINTNNDTY